MTLLDLLGEATPYDLKQLLVRSIENFWPVPHTTFYEEPARLARAGYVSARQEPRGRRRKLYKLTTAGADALRTWRDDGALAPEQVRDEAMLKLFAGGDPRTILPPRRDWHDKKLAELEGYLDALQATRDGGMPADRVAGVEATLIAGTAYHRAMIDLIERGLARAGRASAARRTAGHAAQSGGKAGKGQAATGSAARPSG